MQKLKKQTSPQETLTYRKKTAGKSGEEDLKAKQNHWEAKSATGGGGSHVGIIKDKEAGQGTYPRWGQGDRKKTGG